MRPLTTLLTLASAGVVAGIITLHDHPIAAKSLSSLRAAASKNATMLNGTPGTTSGTLETLASRISEENSIIMMGSELDDEAVQNAIQRHAAILAEARSAAINPPVDFNADRQIWPASPPKPKPKRSTISSRGLDKSVFERSRLYRTHGSTYNRRPKSAVQGRQVRIIKR